MIREDGFHTMEFSQFWEDRISITGNVPTLITGIGFDPRSLHSARLLLNIGHKARIIPIEFSVETVSEPANDLIEATKKNRELLKDFDLICDPIQIQMYDEQNKSIGGKRIGNELYKLKDKLKGIKDLIIDIGGLPRSLFATILSFFIDKQRELGIDNIHMASLPHEELDIEIKSEERLEPNYIFSFERPTDEEKLVWIPVIGKSDPNRLTRIHDKIGGNCIEICPVLHFSTTNPHKTDELLVGLRKVFEELGIYKNNILYVDHRSPFNVYREIYDIFNYHKGLLDSLPGGIKILVTPLDDKTSSVGTILAAKEFGLSIIYSDTVRYKVNNTNIVRNSLPLDSEPMEIWISGEAYES